MKASCILSDLVVVSMFYTNQPTNYKSLFSVLNPVVVLVQAQIFFLGRISIGINCTC